MPLISRAKAIDLLWAMPLILFYGLAAGGLGQKFIIGFQALQADRFPLLQTTALLAQSLSIIFTCLMVMVLLIRRLPVARTLLKCAGFCLTEAFPERVLKIKKS
jgi:hypothetical protein